ADRAGAELPPVRVQSGHVFQLEVGFPLRGTGKPDLDGGRGAAELPADLEQPGWLAAQDLTARVALQLVAPAEAKVPGDRQEPAREALRRGARVPHVADLRVVAAAQQHGDGVAGL